MSKDLTPEECSKICNKQRWCLDCPLVNTEKCLNFDEDINREVEVDE